MSRRSRVTCCSGLSRDSFQIAVSAPLKAGPLRQPALSARRRTAFTCAALGIAPPPTVLLKTYICAADIGQGAEERPILPGDLLSRGGGTYTPSQKRSRGYPPRAAGRSTSRTGRSAHR